MSSGIMAIGETKNGRSGDAGGTVVHQAGGAATCDLSLHPLTARRYPRLPFGAVAGCAIDLINRQIAAALAQAGVVEAVPPEAAKNVS
jgi:hypothetical protein